MIPEDIVTRVATTLIVAAVVGMGGWLYRIWDTQRSQTRQIKRLNSIVRSFAESVPDAQAAQAFRNLIREEEHDNDAS